MRILCLFGCVYQMFNLNVIYFSYETTTNVRYEVEPYLPAIIICYDKWNQFNDEFINKFESDYRKFFNVLGNMTIKQQFDVMHKSPRILQSCKLNSKKKRWFFSM